jgi:hypothetical protein
MHTPSTVGVAGREESSEDRPSMNHLIMLCLPLLENPLHKQLVLDKGQRTQLPFVSKDSWFASGAGKQEVPLIPFCMSGKELEEGDFKKI